MGGQIVWEHAPALIGIPAAIKATLEVIEKLRGGAPHAAEAAAAKANLSAIAAALDTFADDAVELAALKDLHALTNQFMIDLKYAFAIVGPDPAQSRTQWVNNINNIKLEFMSMREGARAAAQLAALRGNPLLMKYLRRMPAEVMEKVPTPPWDRYFWELLARTEGEVENFANLNSRIAELRSLNSLLNNYADRSLKLGISEFDVMMTRLRIEIGRVDLR